MRARDKAGDGLGRCLRPPCALHADNLLLCFFAAAGLASDLGKAKHTASTIRLDDIDRISKQEGQKGDGTGPKAGATSVSVPPDAIAGHTGAAKAMLGGKPPLKAGEEEEVKPAWENSMVSKYVPEDYLGRFWFDGAAVLLAVLTTYFLTRFGGGIFAMLIVGAFFTTYYNASSRRTRQRIRDDIAREMVRRAAAARIGEDLRRALLTSLFLYDSLSCPPG